MKKTLITIALLSISFISAAEEVVETNPSCSGSGLITQSLNMSKLFFTVNTKKSIKKVAYSNEYGTTGSTNIRLRGVSKESAFDIGNRVSYVGIQDASGICVPNVVIAGQ